MKRVVIFFFIVFSSFSLTEASDYNKVCIFLNSVYSGTSPYNYDSVEIKIEDLIKIDHPKLEQGDVFSVENVGFFVFNKKIDSGFVVLGEKGWCVIDSFDVSHAYRNNKIKFLPSKHEAPLLVINFASLNIGKLIAGSTLRKSILLHNTSNYPTLIKSITPTCSCTKINSVSPNVISAYKTTLIDFDITLDDLTVESEASFKFAYEAKSEKTTELKFIKVDTTIIHPISTSSKMIETHFDNNESIISGRVAIKIEEGFKIESITTSSGWVAKISTVDDKHVIDFIKSIDHTRLVSPPEGICGSCDVILSGEGVKVHNKFTLIIKK